jgi:polysaccharide pyruvyl transferase WcaK-like protein
LCGFLDSSEPLGRPQFTVLTSGAEAIEARYRVEALAPRSAPLRVLRALKDADLLVFTGGTPFYESLSHMLYFAVLAGIARAFGVPVVAFGISLRGFRSAPCRMLMRRIAMWSSLLGGREELTVRNLRQYADRPDKSVYVPDTAILMLPAAESEARRILAAAGCDLARPTVAISMRDFRSDRRFQKHHYSRSLSDDTLRRYRETFREIAECAVRDFDFDVVFLPMHTHAPDDDRRIMREVVEGIEDEESRSRCSVVMEQCGPREMKAILALMHATIGVRFHSLVLSASVGTPAFAFCYALKNREIMRGLGFEQFAIDLEKIGTEPVIRRLREFFEQRDQIAEQLRVQSRDQREILDRGVQRLRDLVGGEQHE